MEGEDAHPAGSGVAAGSEAQRPRRPPSSALRRAREIAIGVDLGGTKIETVAVRAPSAEVIAQARGATPAEGGPQSVVAAIVDAVADVGAAAGAADHNLLGVGVGVPGQVDSKLGIVKGGSNVSGFGKPLELARLLEGAIAPRLGSAVALRVENDVRAAVLGELRLGTAGAFQSLLAIWLGTGVGGAVVCAGALHVGAGGAGEIGHLVVKPGGRRCTCGRRGCLEAYIGRACMEATARKRLAAGEQSALFELMRERGRDRLTAGIWQRAYKRHDQLARSLLRGGGRALGVAMASAQNLLDCEAILIGGGLGEKLPAGVLERARKEMGRHLLAPERAPLLVRTALGDLGGAIGAALLAVPAPSVA